VIAGPMPALGIASERGRRDERPGGFVVFLLDPSIGGCMSSKAYGEYKVIATGAPRI
jgi:hypothetical protein